VKIDSRQVVPRLDGILENWSKNRGICIATDAEKDANLQTGRRGGTDSLEHLFSGNTEKFDYSRVKASLHIANVLIEVSGENNFCRLVVTIGSREPSNGVLDEDAFEFLERVIAKIIGPKMGWIGKFIRVKIVKEFPRKASLDMEMSLRLW